MPAPLPASMVQWYPVLGRNPCIRLVPESEYTWDKVSGVEVLEMVLQVIV